MTKEDINFNPYKIGDTLFFESNNGLKDTIIVVSIDKYRLREKCYSSFQCFWSYFTNGYWESYSVNVKKPNSHGEAWSEILTIRAENNSTKTIIFNFNVNGASWYGCSEDKSDKILSYPLQTFKRGSQTLNDVLAISSDNKEYRDRTDFVEKFYWSKSKGYVGFEMLNGITWQVTKK